VEHLIARGHRRIGFLGDRPEVFTAAERLRGYRETLANHGLAEDLDLVRHPRFRGVDAYETTCELLGGSNPPTALFASQNLIAIGAVRALHALGRQHEVAMVSFDDVQLADALDPGLTAVAQDPHALGRAAAELVFSRLDGYDGPSRRVVVPTQLIERGSGELAPPTG
jgi:LacI family transcriptional regulator